MIMQVREAEAVLGLESVDYTLEDVKRSYKKYSKCYHPDSGGSKEEFERGVLAYEVLKEAKEKIGKELRLGESLWEIIITS